MVYSSYISNKFIKKNGAFNFKHTLYICIISVGEPISVEQFEKPTQELIDKYHEIYLERLSKVFDDNKVKYGISEDKKLNFV